MSAPMATDPFSPVPEPPPERESLSTGVLVALAVLAAAIVVGGGLYSWRDAVASETPRITIVPEDDEGAAEATEDDDAPTATTTTTEQPAGGSTAAGDEDGDADSEDAAEHATCPSGTEELFCELVAFVETTRGRPFQEFPTIELSPVEEFRERLLDGFEEETTDLENYGDLLRSLGLIPADTDIVAVYRSLLEVGVVGFYDTETHELVVRGGEFDLYVQSVLVHELAHAHDDQWVDLDRPDLEDATDESAAGFLAVTEGNAERVSEAWLATLSDADRAEVDRAALDQLTPEDYAVLARIPTFLAQDLGWPYTEGLELVNAIYAAGGEDAVDAAYDDPPETSEEILHPELYLAGEDYQELPIPEHPGNFVVDGVIGEIWFRFWLGEEAAEGWGADRFVTYRDGDRLCTIVDVEADTARDLDEMETTLAVWVDAGSGRSVEPDGDGLRIESCIAD